MDGFLARRLSSSDSCHQRSAQSGERHRTRGRRTRLDALLADAAAQHIPLLQAQPARESDGTAPRWRSCHGAYASGRRSSACSSLVDGGGGSSAPAAGGSPSVAASSAPVTAATTALPISIWPPRALAGHTRRLRDLHSRAQTAQYVCKAAWLRGSRRAGGVTYVRTNEASCSRYLSECECLRSCVHDCVRALARSIDVHTYIQLDRPIYIPGACGLEMALVAAAPLTASPNRAASQRRASRVPFRPRSANSESCVVYNGDPALTVTVDNEGDSATKACFSSTQSPPASPYEAHAGYHKRHEPARCAARNHDHVQGTWGSSPPAPLGYCAHCLAPLDGATAGLVSQHFAR